MLGNVGDESTIGCWLASRRGIDRLCGARSFALLGSDSKPRGQLPFGRNPPFPSSNELGGRPLKNATRVGRSPGARRAFLLKLVLADRLVPDVVAQANSTRALRLRERAWGTGPAVRRDCDEGSGREKKGGEARRDVGQKSAWQVRTGSTEKRQGAPGGGCKNHGQQA